VAPLCERERVVIQHGHTAPRSQLQAEWHEFLSTDEMRATISAASTVICHAGVGCIMTALARDRRPIVLPRLRGHGEHVDDHQLQIARELDACGLVTMHREGDSLATTLSRVRPRPASLDAAGRLRAEIERYVRAPAPPRRSRRRQAAAAGDARTSPSSASSSSSSPLT
jgi:UDP-N-acetylglucosamine transferase subunit ALG13